MHMESKTWTLNVEKWDKTRKTPSFALHKEQEQ